MLIAKKLFSFYYCYTGRRNLTIHKLLKNSNTMAKNLHHFSTQRIWSERVISKKQQAKNQLQWLRHGSQHIYFISFTLIQTQQKGHQNA